MMMIPERLKMATRDNRGVMAVEFALLAPALLAFVVGTVNAGLLVFSMTSLNYATERAARCASINTTLCATETAAMAYAASNYYASGRPVFTLTNNACGVSVTGAIDFDISAVVFRKTVKLTSTACFPT